MDMTTQADFEAGTPLERLTALEEIVGAILSREPDFTARLGMACQEELDDPIECGKTEAEMAFRERVEMTKQELLYGVLQSIQPQP